VLGLGVPRAWAVLRTMVRQFLGQLVLALSATSVALTKVDANGAGRLANRFSSGEGKKRKATPSWALE
jgi:hypothetical protein